MWPVKKPRVKQATNVFYSRSPLLNANPGVHCGQISALAIKPHSLS